MDAWALSEIWESAWRFFPAWIAAAIAGLTMVVGYFGQGRLIMETHERRLEVPSLRVFRWLAVAILFLGAFVAFHLQRLGLEEKIRASVAAVDYFIPLDPELRSKVVEQLKATKDSPLCKERISIVVEFLAGSDLRARFAEELVSLLAESGLDVGLMETFGAHYGERDLGRTGISILVAGSNSCSSFLFAGKLDALVHAHFSLMFDQQVDDQMIIRISGNPRFLSDGTVILDH